MRLGIDIDGTIADFIGGWTRRYVDHFDIPVASADIIDWDFLSLTHFDNWTEFWEWIKTSRTFRNLLPYPGAVQGLRSARRIGHDVAYITHRPEWAREVTEEWLDYHGFVYGELFMMANKQHVECDVYLDDAPHVLAELRSACPPTIRVVRMVRPWNRPLEGVVDLHGWRDFSKAVLR